MLTLGIETSCDETAVALYDSEEGLVGESVFSQIDMHAEYGGVVPELASRDHCLKIISVLEDALGARNISEITQRLFLYPLSLFRTDGVRTTQLVYLLTQRVTC